LSLEISDISEENQVLTKFYEKNPEFKDEDKKLKVRFALSQKQREELLQIARNTNYKHYLIIKTQLETGMRIGEIVHLPIQAINFSENYIHLEFYQSDRYLSSWSPKTKSGNRIVPLHKELANELSGFIATRKNGYVFESNKQNKQSCFSEISLINMINTYALKCTSIKNKIGSHCLRRTYASYLMNNGTPIGKISKILGHKSVQITMRYLFDVVDLGSFTQVREVVSKMNNGGKKK